MKRVCLSVLFALISLYGTAQEGFFPNTLVHSAGVQLPIAELTPTVVVLSYDQELQPIISVTKVFVDRYIKLIVADGVIRVGCKQKFCTYGDEWICADNLHVGEMLLDVSGNYHLIEHIQVVYKPTMLYALTTENHIFCIEPYALLVHNMAAALGSVPTISLGTISIANPVTVAFGVTLALSAVTYRALDSWHNQQHETTALPESVMLAERIYYESRKQELSKFKNELSHVKEDLQTIKALCNSSTYSFTSIFLSKVGVTSSNTSHPWLAITKNKELQLTKAQQQELRMLREKDLSVCEQEIITLQVALAVHSNELLGQVDACCADYRIRVSTWNSAFKEFERGCLAIKAIGQLYGCLVTQEYALERLAKTVQEACLVGDYYQQSQHTSSCIKNSTTLLEKWQQLLPCVRANKQWIEQDRRICIQCMSRVEEYLKTRGGPVVVLKANLLKTIEKYFGSHEATTLAIAINKFEVVTQEVKTTIASLPPQANENKEVKTLEDILADAELLEVKDAKIYGKKGGYKEALEDFESLQPTQVIDIPKNNIGKIGVLPDGRRVNVRIGSTDKRPTLEIQPPKGVSGKVIKVRYGTK